MATIGYFEGIGSVATVKAEIINLIQGIFDKF